MNVADFLVLRHTGFEPSLQTDIAIRRLKCNHNDVYRGIVVDEHESNSHLDSPIITCRFSNNKAYPDLLALASDDGRVAVQNTSLKYPPNSSIKGEAAHHDNAIFDIAWMPDELKLVTASGDHTAKLWNLRNSCMLPVSEFQSHTGSIKTVVFRPDDKNIFATGARDGAIFIWDVRDRNKKPDNSIFNGHRMDSSNSVKHRQTLVYASPAEGITGLIFQDVNTLISCAAGDGLIKIWDLRKNYSVRKNQPCAKHVLSYSGGTGRNGFSSLTVCPARLKLYVNCIDDVIYAYNLSSYNERPIAEFHGHQNSSYYVKNCLSPDGRYLASGSSDENAYIWRTDKPGAPLVRLKGHTQEVTCVTWSNLDEPRIVTSSDDCRHRVWRVGLEQAGDNDEIEIRGNAEAVESTNHPTHSNRRTLHIVPRGWGGENGTTSGNVMSRIIKTKRNGTGNTGSEKAAKRTLDEASNESKINGHIKSILSPIEESYEPLTKRSYTESNGAHILSSLINTNESRSAHDYDSDGAGQDPISVLPKIEEPFSPTLNLPNFVSDGSAPHLIPISPEKSKENIDWLTKIRQTRYERRLGKSESDKIPNPNTEVTPARRNSRSRSSEPRHVKIPAISLLNFFKVESPTEKILRECTRRRPESPA